MKVNFLLIATILCGGLTVNSQSLVKYPSAQPSANGFTGKPQYQITTTRAGVFLGNIFVELFPNIAPLAVKNFDSLVSKQFYDSTAFHRVIPGFMIQGGDPNSRHGLKSTWGYGDPNQPTVPAEFSAAQHVRGILSAARETDINSANSQFFICVAPAPWLDGQYSIYGHVTSGMNWADTIVKSPRDVNDNPNQKIEMFITYLGSNDTVPNAPALTLPLYAAVGVSTTPTLKWNAVNDAIIYQVEVATDSLFVNKVISKDAPLGTYAASGLLGLKKYYWRVRTNNGGNFSAYSPIWNFTTQAGPPTLQLPANNSINIAASPLFTWDSVPQATSYRLVIATNTNFTAGGTVYDQDSIMGLSQQVNGLSVNKRYYWRVMGMSGSTPGMYSTTFSFKTAASTGINNLTDAGFLLGQNAPNPCNASSLIEYTIPDRGMVTLKLFDIQGRELATLLNEKKDKGAYEFNLDLSKYPDGNYFYKMSFEEYVQVKRLVVLR